MIDVVCGIIYKDDKVFFCRRNRSKQMGGLWEFPGGKLESDEMPENALRRELLEELEMEVTDVNYFHTCVHQYEEFTIRLSAYKCNFLRSTFRMTDHDKWDWVDIGALLKKNIAPADLPIVEKLMKEQ
ncbi:MAG: (deoxy)nucleoside triphosphate pyrophosphohydrolase [Saprospiraceae bacterium]|nr:(deoxy)nucleoside triphosphate pyrophosphohydrolase [Saprospiraceae bacterium]